MLPPLLLFPVDAVLFSIRHLLTSGISLEDINTAVCPPADTPGLRHITRVPHSPHRDLRRITLSSSNALQLHTESIVFSSTPSTLTTPSSASSYVGVASQVLKIPALMLPPLVLTLPSNSTVTLPINPLAVTPTNFGAGSSFQNDLLRTLVPDLPPLSYSPDQPVLQLETAIVHAPTPTLRLCAHLKATPGLAAFSTTLMSRSIADSKTSFTLNALDFDWKPLVAYWVWQQLTLQYLQEHHLGLCTQDHDGNISPKKINYQTRLLPETPLHLDIAGAPLLQQVFPPPNKSYPSPIRWEALQTHMQALWDQHQVSYQLSMANLNY